jgi:hypothetical protein
MAFDRPSWSVGGFFIADAVDAFRTSLRITAKRVGGVDSFLTIRAVSASRRKEPADRFKINVLQLQTLQVRRLCKAPEHPEARWA